MSREQARTLLGLLQMGAKGVQIVNDEHKYLTQVFDILRYAADDVYAQLEFANSWL